MTRSNPYLLIFPTFLTASAMAASNPVVYGRMPAFAFDPFEGLSMPVYESELAVTPCRGLGSAGDNLNVIIPNHRIADEDRALPEVGFDVRSPPCS